MKADASDPADMRAMVDAAVAALDGLDVYVHCPSGGFEPRDAGDIDDDLWDAAMDSTAKGFMFAAQVAHEVMAAAGGGVIVAITDVAGLQPWAWFAAHGAAKAAQVHLLKRLALAWGRDGRGVRRRSRAGAHADGIAGDPAETALGRLGDPADVAQAVRYCIEAGFVTGQNIVVDGGWLLRP